MEIVVNNAGIITLSSPLSENAEESLTKELDINVFGLLRVADTEAVKGAVESSVNGVRHSLPAILFYQYF